MKYLLIDTNLLHVRRITLAEAAEVMELDPAEVEWALEHANRCDLPPFILIEEEYSDDKPASLA